MKTYSKYLFLIFFLFLFSASDNNLFAQKDGNKSDTINQIRFDGLYRTAQMTDNSADRNQYYSYFRFCENGNVIGMSSTYSAKQVSKWLSCKIEKQRRDFKKGKYKVDNSKISFTTESEAGKVDYEGIVEEKAIVLNVFSQINKNSDKNRKYKFIKVSFDEN